MNEESPRKYRKYWIIAVMALFVGVLAVALADEALDVASSVNASTNITALQNNDTADRAYVNNTFLPLDGGNMTGNITDLGITTKSIIYMESNASASGLNGYVICQTNSVPYTCNKVWTRAKSRIAFSPNTSKPNTFIDIISGFNYNDDLLYEFQSNNSFVYFRGYRTPIQFETRNVGYSGNVNISFAPGETVEMYVNLSDTPKIPRLAGSGNAYPVRSDVNGKLEVNRSAGAGITMKSPDGNSWCLTVTNGGTTLATSGACS